jgi:hypothetical protein
VAGSSISAVLTELVILSLTLVQEYIVHVLSKQNAFTIPRLTLIFVWYEPRGTYRSVDAIIGVINLTRAFKRTRVIIWNLRSQYSQAIEEEYEAVSTRQNKAYQPP